MNIALVFLIGRCPVLICISGFHSLFFPSNCILVHFRFLPKKVTPDSFFIFVFLHFCNIYFDSSGSEIVLPNLQLYQCNPFSPISFFQKLLMKNFFLFFFLVFENAGVKSFFIFTWRRWLRHIHTSLSPLPSRRSSIFIRSYFSSYLSGDRWLFIFPLSNNHASSWIINTHSENLKAKHNTHTDVQQHQPFKTKTKKFFPFLQNSSLFIRSFLRIRMRSVDYI